MQAILVSNWGACKHNKKRDVALGKEIKMVQKYTVRDAEKAIRARQNTDGASNAGEWNF